MVKGNLAGAGPFFIYPTKSAEEKSAEEKVGQFESSAGVAFLALQLLSDSRFIADHASDGSWDHGPCLELGGIDRIRT